MSGDAPRTDARRALPNPARWFFGPVFDKEMRVSGRKMGTYVRRALFVLAVLALAWLTYAGASLGSGYTDSAAARLQSTQEIAPALAFFLLGAQFFTVCLAAPVSTAGSLLSERKRLTLPSLMTTPLSSFEIVASKATAAMVQTSILLLLTTPLLLGARAFGGLPLEQVLSGTALSLAVAWLGVCGGLVVSAGGRRSSVTQLAAQLLFGMALFLPAGLMALWNFGLAELSTGRLAGTISPEAAAGLTINPLVLILSMPVVTFISVVIAGSTPLGTVLTVEWWWSVAYAVGVGWLLLLWAAVAAAGVMRTEAGGDRAARKAAKREARQDRRRAKREARRGPDAGEGRLAAWNPVAWRELRGGLLSRRWHGPALCVLILGALGVTYWFAEIDENTALVGVPLVIALLAHLAQCASLPAGGVASEREGRTWETLLTTRLSPGQIVAGKFLGVLRKLWLGPMVIVFHAAAMFAVGELSALAFPLLLTSLVGPTVLLCGVGTLFGLMFRKGTTGSASTFGVAAGLWLGLPILAGIGLAAFSALTGSDFEPVLSVVLLINPVYVAVEVVNELATWNLPATVSSTDFNLPHGPMGYGAFLFVQLLVCGVQCGVGVGALWAAVTGFGRLAPRTS